MSQNRYKSIKSWNPLENVIFKQKPFLQYVIKYDIRRAILKFKRNRKRKTKIIKSSKKENKEITEIPNKILEK